MSWRSVAGQEKKAHNSPNFLQKQKISLPAVMLYLPLFSHVWPFFLSVQSPILPLRRKKAHSSVGRMLSTLVLLQSLLATLRNQSHRKKISQF